MISEENERKIIRLLESIDKSNRQIVNRLEDLVKAKSADYSGVLGEIANDLEDIKSFHEGQRA